MGAASLQMQDSDMLSTGGDVAVIGFEYPAVLKEMKEHVFRRHPCLSRLPKGIKHVKDAISSRCKSMAKIMLETQLKTEEGKRTFEDAFEPGSSKITATVLRKASTIHRANRGNVQPHGWSRRGTHRTDRDERDQRDRRDRRDRERGERRGERGDRRGDRRGERGDREQGDRRDRTCVSEDNSSRDESNESNQAEAMDPVHLEAMDPVHLDRLEDLELQEDELQQDEGDVGNDASSEREGANEDEEEEDIDPLSDASTMWNALPLHTLVSFYKHKSVLYALKADVASITLQDAKEYHKFSKKQAVAHALKNDGHLADTEKVSLALQV